MQRPGKLQAVVFAVMMVAAAGCAATKEYTSKLFKPAGGPASNTQATALRFLDIEGIEGNQDDWVSTDLLKSRDSTSEMIAIEKIDRLAERRPARPDSSLLTGQETRPETKSVVKKTPNGQVREKRVRE